MLKSILRSKNLILAAVPLSLVEAYRYPTLADGTESKRLSQQPAFVSISAAQRGIGKKASKDAISLDSMVMIAGTAHVELSKEISMIIGVPLAATDLKRFADGEVSIQINENLRGKDVFILQTCAAPVNDSIMELLLSVSCARYDSDLSLFHMICLFSNLNVQPLLHIFKRRSGARRVIAVIPYFGYKHHRRGASISTRHHSRFLSSSAMDFAKMLQEMG